MPVYSQQRNIMRYILVMLAGLASLSAVAAADEPVIPPDKEIISFETKTGTVTFLHRLHADLSVTRCDTCHHTWQPGDERIKACHECHGGAEAGAPGIRTAFHSTCIGCHEYTVAHGGEPGPLENKCALCHVK